ncbi:hypothetical protein [Gracilibacillus alcaliphilus]|uniref:hypothetical protein n=1 Tax=Gracilibacillus alcaliphilus TaxID=1401441 RepID=UPI00195688A7|nr:glucan phosphoethanolaminetransferase (alkaline phosphatase superfamily) [Gracilibacillus alcaliphilus]
MYFYLVFIHVVSALFLGCFLAFPLAMNRLFSLESKELIISLKTILSFTRAGHYALVLLMISGIWMTIGYTSYPSLLWVGISILILILIGALIGMVHKQIKQIMFTADSAKELSKNRRQLTRYGWMTFFAILIAIFIMTNRSLF